MEYLDVLDENGNLTGKKKLRTDVHRDGDWHRAIFVLIMNSKNELLIQKRSAIKEIQPNKWDISVAGHIPAGISSVEAAIKETDEELGVSIKKEELEFLFSYKHKTYHNDGNFINAGIFDIYLLEKDLDIEKLKLQTEEVSEAKYISIDELEKAVLADDPTFVQHKMSYPRIINILRKKI